MMGLPSTLEFFGKVFMPSLSFTDEQFEENASSRQSSSLDSASIVAARESKRSSNPFISAAASDIHQLKGENKRLKREKTKWEKEISEKNQLEKVRDDLLARPKNLVKELREIQQEKDKIVKLMLQNDGLQTDLRAEESQVHEQETCLTTAQQALEDMQQLKDENNRLKPDKCQWEKEESDLLAQKESFEKELHDVQHEKDELVLQNVGLQIDLRAKESQIYELETSLATAQQALEDMQQLKDENDRLKLEKCHWEKEESDWLAEKESFEEKLHDVEHEKDELVLQNDGLQIDLRAKESQAYELETSLATAQQALENMQHLKDENDRLKLEKCQWEKEESDLLGQKESFEKELHDTQHEKDELVVQNNSLQTNLRAKEALVRELETTLSTAQRVLEEYRQKESGDWVVSCDEVQMTGKCLGEGGWGKVVLGTFRGCKVAVKQIHELILSPYNRRLFEREMSIASRCRHPCLLQFIGATNDDGSPLFITELLETSLRALLGQRQLTDTEISIISLDISLALNYLHNMKPSPILHRDVSSANVLLWRQGDQWRGKVSDYGTAKFVQQTMTRAPGAVIYSAPEAVSSNQTSKVSLWTIMVIFTYCRTGRHNIAS